MSGDGDTIEVTVMSRFDWRARLAVLTGRQAKTVVTILLDGPVALTDVTSHSEMVGRPEKTPKRLAH